MFTVRPLSARVTLFSSRLIENTDLLEIVNLPCSSCPRTGTRRGPSTGSSYLISFTLDRSGGGEGGRVSGVSGEVKEREGISVVYPFVSLTFDESVDLR